jgi:MFS family permease
MSAAAIDQARVVRVRYDPRHMANRWVALAIVFVTRTSMGFQFQAVAAVAPLMVADLGLTWVQLGSLIGLYMLPGAVFALPGGMLGQRFGERRMVVGSLALMVAGGLVTAAAHGFIAAVAGRLLSGIGAVLMNILLAKMVADWFAGREMSTAMGIMLTSWPVGLGIATATLGALATHASWRAAIVATALVAALGLVLIAFVYRDPPRLAGAAGRAVELRERLSGRELGLATSAGFAWGCFNASLVAIIAFGPGLLMARGASLGDAGFTVSLAIWLTMLSVPLGGLLSDRLGRPNLLIVVGSLVAALVTLLLPAIAHSLLAFCLVGLAIGAPPGALMALLPKAVASERLATALGVYYTTYYVVMAAVQLAAGGARDLFGSPTAPILLAALVMAATIVGFAIFRLVERTAPRLTGRVDAPR